MVIAERVPRGLHPERIRKELGLSREKMGYALSVSAKTIENWERRDQLPSDDDKRARLVAIAEVAHVGALVYGPDGLPVFLQTPLRALGDRTPLQEIMAGRVERVIEILAAEYEGLGF